MTEYTLTRLRALHRDEGALSTTEYIIILILVAILGIFSWNAFGDSLQEKVDEANDGVGAQMDSPGERVTNTEETSGAVGEAGETESEEGGPGGGGAANSDAAQRDVAAVGVSSTGGTSTRGEGGGESGSAILPLGILLLVVIGMLAYFKKKKGGGGGGD